MLSLGRRKGDDFATRSVPSMHVSDNWSGRWHWRWTEVAGNHEKLPNLRCWSDRKDGSDFPAGRQIRGDHDFWTIRLFVTAQHSTVVEFGISCFIHKQPKHLLFSGTTDAYVLTLGTDPNGGNEYVWKTLNTLSLADYLNKYVGWGPVDYLSVDTEGSEYSMLMHLAQDGGFAANRSICQINIELHGPLEVKQFMKTVYRYLQK